MQIKNVQDDAFRPYGRILQGYALTELLQAMEETPLPEDVVYVASDKKLESLGIYKDMQDSVYGGMPVQIGYCNGHNQKLNGLEYHRNSEINVAVTDMILILGKQQDVEADFTYATERAEAFFVPAGTMIEVYATTLHYAPCGVDRAGFRCVVVLPKGTNEEGPATAVTAEDRLRTARNKWLIAHPDAHIAGAFNGLKGENLTV